MESILDGILQVLQDIADELRGINEKLDNNIDVIAEELADQLADQVNNNSKKG